jgi:hypothetical protein
MNISIVDNAIDWRNALRKFDIYESYHTWDFHRIDTSRDNEFFALEVTSEDSTLFFPVVSRKIPGSEFHDLTSVYGYPGPIYAGAPKKFPQFLDAALSRFRDMGYISIFSRCSAFSTTTIEQYPDCYFSSGKIITIDLSLSMSDQWRQYRGNLRREITKAIDIGLKCDKGKLENTSEFIELYHKTMNRLDASSHYYFDEKYMIEMLTSKDFDCRLYLCKYNDKIISGAIFLFCNGVVQYHISASDAAYSKLAATKLIIDFVRRIAFEEGFLILNLGGGFGGQMDHLYNFKRGFTKNEKEFLLIKKVLDNTAYHDLISSKNFESLGTDGFFPAYRN